MASVAIRVLSQMGVHSPGLDQAHPDAPVAKLHRRESVMASKACFEAA